MMFGYRDEMRPEEKSRTLTPTSTERETVGG